MIIYKIRGDGMKKKVYVMIRQYNRETKTLDYKISYSGGNIEGQTIVPPEIYDKRNTDYRKNTLDELDKYLLNKIVQSLTIEQV